MNSSKAAITIWRTKYHVQKEKKRIKTLNLLSGLVVIIYRKLETTVWYFLLGQCLFALRRFVVVEREGKQVLWAPCSYVTDRWAWLQSCPVSDTSARNQSQRSSHPKRVTWGSQRSVPPWGAGKAKHGQTQATIWGKK
jgi:hypothetical protein